MKRESELRGNRSWLALGIVGIALVAGAFISRANAATSYTPILHPTIFWHDNQWETYENGQWVPYHDPANNIMVTAPEPEEVFVPEEPQPPEMVDTNGFVPGYGWGFIGAPAFYRPHHHALAHKRPEHRRPVNGLGRRNVGRGSPNMGIGQTAIEIGRPNTGIGRPTIGVGQNNAGIGQTTIGIGHPNAGIGQPNVGMGRTSIGIGQPNVGIGQNNAGVGQTTIGIGQPSVGIGQPTIGIGQQMGSQRGGWGR